MWELVGDEDMDSLELLLPLVLPAVVCTCCWGGTRAVTLPPVLDDEDEEDDPCTIATLFD